MSDHIGYDAEMVAAFLEPRASENVPAQYAHALAHMAFYANAECEEWKAVAEGKLLGVLAERDALKAENEKLHTAILRSPGEIWWLNVADEERKRADALLRMNENLTEECERKHRLIEELKADRDSRDDKIDALKAQLADAAKVSDGVWEWVPKPKYDALLAQKCELIERVTRLFKTAEAERQREMGPDTSAVGKMHAYLKVLRLLESDEVVPIQNDNSEQSDEQGENQ